MDTTTPGKSPIEMAPMAKCEHPACICTVSPGERFCSDSCAAHLGEDDEGDLCDCGHPECANAARVPAIPGGAVVS